LLGLGNQDNMGDADGEVASLNDVDLGPGRTVVQLAVGGLHNCAMLDDGQLYEPQSLSLPWVDCIRLDSARDVLGWP